MHTCVCTKYLLSKYYKKCRTICRFANKIFAFILKSKTQRYSNTLSQNHILATLPLPAYENRAFLLLKSFNSSHLED